MKIFKNILTFLLVLAIPALFAIISFSFSQSDTSVAVEEEIDSIDLYTATIDTLESWAQTIKKVWIDNTNKNQDILLDKNQVWYIEFWKLATAFFLWGQSGALSYSQLSLSWRVLTIDPKYSSIISLYDPFATYTINSVYNDFSIAQITNGSFFIWLESDWTYSMYSIDSVVRLDLLSNWKKMTDMVFFPGMYMRFNPKMNSSLDGANLFRIMQSLQPNGTEDESPDSTWIEFVNPRMNTGNEKDSFLMYRLPTRTKLFQLLHILFYERVSQVDVYEEYGRTLTVFTEDEEIDSWLVNPGKKSHILLLKLDSILARAMRDNRISIDTFQSEIKKINEAAHTLGLWNSVESRLEKFLTDGRFALFGGKKINPQFPDIYQAVSEEVGKAPVTPHAKLLQRLSDIYSKNLVAQKKDLSFSKIDTYSPTALELEKTLQSTDVQQRDYFDIALYAFNVLKKAEDRWVFVEEAVYLHPTYSLIQTILVSTDRYTKSITDPERRRITYEWIALYFYQHVLSVLTNTVYATFTQVEDWKVLLRPGFRPTLNEPQIQLDETIIRDIQNIDGILLLISERMDEQYGNDSSNSVYLDIKKHITLYRGFAKLLDVDTYRQYEKLPYVSDATQEYWLPILDESWNFKIYNPLEIKNDDGEWQVDPSIESLMWIFSNITKDNIVLEGAGYRVQNITKTLTDPATQEPVEVLLTLDFNKSVTEFSNLNISYSWRNIQVLTDKKSTSELQDLLVVLPTYITRMNVLFSWNPSLVGWVRFLDTSEKISVGTYIFSLVP